MTTEEKLLANMYAALDKAMPLTKIAAPEVHQSRSENPDGAPSALRPDPDPTHWSNWQTRGNVGGDTSCGMPLRSGE